MNTDGEVQLFATVYVLLKKSSVFLCLTCYLFIYLLINWFIYLCKETESFGEDFSMFIIVVIFIKLSMVFFSLFKTINQE